MTALSAHHNLSERFAQHLAAIDSTIKPAKSAALWQNIAEHYNKAIRFYHNQQHLEQLFQQFDTIKSQLKQPLIIALALFYHDIIYDPTRQDNELKSAEYAVDKLGKHLSDAQCARVYALIMMTATHNIDDKDGNIFDSDAAFLLDMDLSILGADWSDYERYAQAIRQEYSHVSIDDYRYGRIAVLQGLLAHDRLYLTDDYHARLEQRARQNIEGEIESLATKTSF